MKYPRRSIALFLFLCAYMFSSVVSAETYYVATSGSDSGTGSLSRPFGSISAASSVMVEGDTCMIYGGIYRETIIPLVDDVSYQAVQGEEVTLTGFDAVDSWSVYSESIYVADIDWTLGEEDQVFFDGKMMTLARWPNKTNDNLFDLEMQKASGTNSSVSHASIPDQNWANGGVILFLGKSRWTSWRVDITQSENGMVGFDELSTNWDFSGAHSPTQGGEFYLMNTLEALDNEEEWYIDRANGKVYLYAPGGVDPDTGDALVRRRTTLAALNGREGVTLNNLVFFGGNVNLKGSKDCTIKHCRIRYGNHTIASNSGAVIPHASIVMDGDSVGNTIYRNEVQWGGWQRCGCEWARECGR